MIRGRKTQPTPDTPDVQVNGEAIAAAGNALTELARRSAEIAQAFDDGLPYDRNRMVSEARYFMSQSAEAMLEAGKRLVVLKENEPHGDFIELLESRLGLNERTAQRMMAASVKYLSPALAAKAPTLSVLGKSKLFELMVEDDSTLEELANGGTLAGKSIDEIEAMSVRELRASLLEWRKKAAAKDALIAKKDHKLNELTEADERRRSGTPSEREAQQLADVREVGLAAEMAVRKLLAVCAEVHDAPATDAAGTAARQAVEFVAQVMAGLINERGIPVDLAEMVTPHWLAAVPKAGAKARS